MRPYSIAGRWTSRWPGCEPPAKGVIDHLLEGLALPVSLFMEEAGHIWLERQGGPHEGIMMLAFVMRQPSGISDQPNGAQGACSAITGWAAF